MKKFFLYLFVFASVGDFAYARTFKEFVDGISSNIFLSLSYLFMSSAIVLFFAGMVKFIWNQRNGKDTRDDKAMMTWGILTLFVMFSIWGLISLTQRTLSDPVKGVDFTQTKINVPSYNFDASKLMK